MSQADKSYKTILEEVLTYGEKRKTRSGDVITMFAPSAFRFSMRQGFPLLTCKRTLMRLIIGEALWFLNGETDLGSLRKRTWGFDDGEKRTIWTDDFIRYRDMLITKYGMPEDALSLNQCLGRLYGAQWRDSHGDDCTVDQIEKLVRLIKKDPYSRYMLINSWNPAEIDSNMMALPPCHVLFQTYVTNNNEMDLLWYQRSVDTFLGLPFNIASYGFILAVLAKITGKKVRNLIGYFGDTQVYCNHIEQVQKTLQNPDYNAPSFDLSGFDKLTCLDDLKNMTADDFLPFLENYQHAGEIKAPLSVG